MNGKRLKNLEIRAGPSPVLEENPVVGTFKGPGVKGGEHYISFGRKITVDYISFQIKGSQQILQINGIAPQLEGIYVIHITCTCK